MSKPAAPRSVIVVGGTGAIGSALVRELSASTLPYVITAVYSRDGERAEKLRAETQCVLFRADVGEEAEVEKLFASTSAPFAVVHATGVAGDGLLARQSRGAWDEVLRIHSDSAFLVARAALQKLCDCGRLIFISSRVGEVGNAGQAAYAAAKSASNGLMKSAAIEGASRRIAVNAICPGFIPSGMTEMLSGTQLQAARAASLRNEFGSAIVVASLVNWLLSDEAASVSGQVLHCDNRI